MLSNSVFPNWGYYFIPRDSASSWAVLSKGFVRDIDTCLTAWLGYDHTAWPSLKCHKLFLTIRSPARASPFRDNSNMTNFFWKPPNITRLPEGESCSIQINNVVVQQSAGKTVGVTRWSQPLQPSWITQLLAFLITGTHLCIYWCSLEPQHGYGMF